jgi:cytochrome c oxidase subunit I
MTDAGSVRDDAPRTWRRYVYAVSHRDIGIMFLCFAALAGIVGFAMVLSMRGEMMEPGLQIFRDSRRFCVLDTGSGIVTLFFCILPAAVGFGYWLIPLVIGAPNLAFVRMGNLSFWLMPFAFAVFSLSFCVAGDAGGSGLCADWTLSPPLSTYGSPGPAADFVIAAMLMAAVSLLLAAVDFVATILNMRAPGMTLSKMPLLPWSLLIASFLIVLATPALSAALIMLLADRHFGATVFNPAGGGNPLLYRHLFWYFGNAAAWASVLPGIGMVGHVVYAFSGKPGFGRLGIVYAMIALAAVGLIGWGRHLSTAGMPFDLQAFFLIVGLAVAAPAAALIFALVAVLWGGSISFRAPMLWAIGFLPVFAVGVLSAAALNGGVGALLHGSTFETAGDGYLVVFGPAMAFFAGWYFWFPKFAGYRWSDALAKLHCVLTFVGGNLMLFPLFLLGMAGMPAGAADYPAVFAGWNHLAGVGAYIAAAGGGVFLIGLFEALIVRRRAGANPWGTGADGLEWTLPSPPPYRTFDQLPVIR